MMMIHILLLIYFVVKVKDKDPKVGKGPCDYDVMTMCCVMGRAESWPVSDPVSCD